MTISTYTILTPDECTRCSSCGAPLAVGDTVSECDGRPFCGQTCLSEYVGRLMARLHGPAAQYDAQGLDEDGYDAEMMNRPR